ncbi:perilipin-5-like isoform X1 [Dromaius novaehollandiae]|uniref:perilipin-5-like isoform X1 n=1 Tax=Dromaius novaehollandiae TaxID=8790 RepID=UPI00311DF294
MEERPPVPQRPTAKVGTAWSLEWSRAALGAGVGTVAASPAGRMVAAGLDAVLSKSEELLERYLPGPAAQPAPAALETAEQRQSYAARLGALSAELRHRVLRRLRQLVRPRPDPAGRRGSSRCPLPAPLPRPLQVDRAKRGTAGLLRGARRSLHRLGLRLDPGEAAAPEAAAPEAAGGTRAGGGIVAAAASRLAASRLGAACLGAAARLGGLGGLGGPGEPRASRARSLAALPGLVPVPGREWAQVSIEELLAYVAQHAPLPWLVGPFAPVLVERPEDGPVDVAKWRGCLAGGPEERAPVRPRSPGPGSPRGVPEPGERRDF